jgi:hypothetical protein
MIYSCELASPQGVARVGQGRIGRLAKQQNCASACIAHGQRSRDIVHLARNVTF